MTAYTLGLDLGSNSVGWAMVAQNGETFEDGRRIIGGVRVFPEGVADFETKKESPRSQERRERRSQRRVLYRRRQRRHLLARVLRGAGLLPSDPPQLAALMALNPYALRARGLDEALTPHEFGRALYHLCQRRGFRSNLKTDSKDDNKITKGAATLQAEIVGAGCRTLGEYRASKLVGRQGGDNERERVRGRYTLRAMYEEEFEKLWQAQVSFHADALTDDLKARVHEAIFFQRPLRFDPATIGDCDLEEGEKRCPRAHWLAEQFRMLQEINHLRLVRASGEEGPLTAEERARLGNALGRKAKMTFKAIRKHLGLLDAETCNLETEGKRDYLLGNRVEAALRHKALRAWYEGLSEGDRAAVHDAVAEAQDPESLRSQALERWGCTEAQADRLAGLRLPAGHLRLSLMAIRKMLPFLSPDHTCDARCRDLCPGGDPDAGHVVSEAKALAGYELASVVPVWDRLPALEQEQVQQAVGRVSNPLVRRALTETRKVVNAIVRDYGKPAEVVVELAREMKHSRDQRQEIHWENVRRGQENDAIRDRLVSEYGLLSPSREDVLKYRLWQECGEICVYTGKPIPKTKVFSGEVQIEHIYPLDRSLDDSYWNKTLCYGAEVNARKGSRTPYEAYHDRPDYDGILQRARRLPWKKYRRFKVKQVAFNEFAARQLNDTRYASRLAVRYVRCLGVDVRPVKGQTTSKLAHYWGLYGALGTNFSKSRDDHRYHAIDAVAIALTTRSHLQKLSRVIGGRPLRTPLAEPWEGFREEAAAAVRDINVSHRPARKVSGKLHEETAYGPTENPGVYVYRVPVERLTPAMVPRIRDPIVRSIVEARLAERGIEAKGSGALGNILTEPRLTMPSGVPVRRVRITTTEATAVAVRTVGGKAVKFVTPGSNHHMEVYERPDGTYTGRCVTRFEAQERLRRGQPLVCRDAGDGLRFLMSLAINDMVELTDPDTGEVGLYRVQTTSYDSGRDSPDIRFRLHWAARIGDEDKCRRIRSWRQVQAVRPRKVTIDPIGRVFPCGD